MQWENIARQVAIKGAVLPQSLRKVESDFTLCSACCNENAARHLRLANLLATRSCHNRIQLMLVMLL